jgi:cytochrome b6-f complex iron-sulfur subunit
VTDIPLRGSIVVNNPHVSNQPIALYRTSTGSVVAHSAVCTHQGCTVDPAASSTLQCPCHGSAFRSPDGSVINGPNGSAASAITPLARVSVTVVNGSVYLS